MTGCPKDIVVPFILMPGIMGTRLQTQDGRKIWDPDDIFYSLRMAFWSPRQRKREFIGGETHTPGYLIPITKPKKKLGGSIYDSTYGTREERGWGEPVGGFYLSMLSHLDNIASASGMEIVRKNPLCRLKESPAFAIGYAWSDSNLESGRIAAGRISDIVAKCKARARAIGAQCPGAILVTHSMGGYVARAAALLSGAEDDILAVLSNVIPTDGSPTTIKRTHFGNDRPDMGFFGGPSDYVTYQVLGSHGADVSCLFGHMPGAQELFPNKRYKTNNVSEDMNGDAVRPGDVTWLKIRNPDGSIWSEFPAGGNPYTEIYRRSEVMYCGVNPEWLYPEGFNGLDGLQNYIDQNLIAEQYHDEVIAAGDFHPITFLSHSDSDSYPSWDRIVWKADISSGDGKLTSSDILAYADGKGYEYKDSFFGGNKRKERKSNGRKVTFRIEDKAARGDGTVPAGAAHWLPLGDVVTEEDAGPATIGVLHDGYEHGASISDGRVIRWVTEKAVYVISNLRV